MRIALCATQVEKHREKMQKAKEEAALRAVRGTVPELGPTVCILALEGAGWYIAATRLRFASCCILSVCRIVTVDVSERISTERHCVRAVAGRCLMRAWGPSVCLAMFTTRA